MTSEMNLIGLDTQKHKLWLADPNKLVSDYQVCDDIHLVTTGTLKANNFLNFM